MQMESLAFLLNNKADASSSIEIQPDFLENDHYEADIDEILNFMGSKFKQEKSSNKELKRTELTTYQNENEFSLPKTKNFEVQYSNLYFVRLCLIRERLLEKLQRLNLKKLYKKMGELPANEESVIIGTLYKEMKLKPNVLLKMQDLNNSIFKDPPKSYISADDQMFLEEEYGWSK